MDINSTITLIWFEEIKNCSSMFSNCNYISKLDFLKFNSSKAIDMSKMFYQCYNLEELNLNNFITSSVKKYGVYVCLFQNSIIKFIKF